MESAMGEFVCPEWAINYWERDQSTIVQCTDGQFAVVCNAVQEPIFIGNESECWNFLGRDDDMGIFSGYGEYDERFNDPNYLGNGN